MRGLASACPSAAASAGAIRRVTCHGTGHFGCTRSTRHTGGASASSLGVAIVVLIAPAIALASHQFGDVPTSASYHDEVESLVNAGITSGCGGGNYCPNQAVTRGQMAQFMTRGLGIATAGYGELAASQTDDFYVATVAIHTVGLPGKTGFVTVDADLSVLDLNGLCPCGIIFSIEENDDPRTRPDRHDGHIRG